MRSILISLCLLVLAISAQAQERVVRLQSGGAVWRVLANQGCTTAQIASLWPLVVADSGLDPRNERLFPVGTPIAIKRDCDGQPLGESVLRFENEDLKKRLAELTAQLGDSKAEATRLQGEVNRLTGELADAGNLSATQALGIPILTLAVGLVAGKFFSRPKRSPALAPGTRVSPPQVVVDRHGDSAVYDRHEDPGSLKVWYTCPESDCGAKIPFPENCERHDREWHSERSRTQWAFPQERAPDSPSL